VALLSVKGEKAQFIFARSTDLRYDMRPLLQEACSLVGGSGGGGPELAQGGGPDAKRIDEALHHATEFLRSQIKLAGGA
jgi:alanyl-tRNA synthetase